MDANRKKVLSVVAPVYNEELLINKFFERLSNALLELSTELECEINFIDDGSEDNTLSLMTELKHTSAFNVNVYSFRNNQGLERAIDFGLSVSNGDFIVVMDTDLQDPPELIVDMMRLIEEGHDVVHARRKKREFDPLGKIVFAKIFYFFMGMFGSSFGDLANYKLMSANIVKLVLNRPYKSTLFRISVFKHSKNPGFVDYSRDLRSEGHSKFTFLKSLDMAIGGSSWAYAINILAIFMCVLGFIIILLSIFIDISSSIILLILILLNLLTCVALYAHSKRTDSEIKMNRKLYYLKKE